MDEIADSQYGLVVFVIGIVVLSTMYFGAVLLLELYRSCIYYKHVVQAKIRERKRQKEGGNGDDNEAETHEEVSDINIAQESAALTDHSVESWRANPQVSPVTECEEDSSSKQPDNTGTQPASIHVGTDRLASLSSYSCNSSDGAGIQRRDAERTKVKQRNARFGGKDTRKKNFDLEPSMVGHEQDEEKGSDDEPSMVQTHNTYHINPDSKLGNALRVLKKTASAVVDDDPGRSASAAAPQSSLHRTPSGRLSSMYGDDSDIL